MSVICLTSCNINATNRGRSSMIRARWQVITRKNACFRNFFLISSPHFISSRCFPFYSTISHLHPSKGSSIHPSIHPPIYPSTRPLCVHLVRINYASAWGLSRAWIGARQYNMQMFLRNVFIALRNAIFYWQWMLHRCLILRQQCFFVGHTTAFDHINSSPAPCWLMHFHFFQKKNFMNQFSNSKRFRMSLLKKGVGTDWQCFYQK